MNQFKAIKLDANNQAIEYIVNTLSTPYISRRLSDDLNSFMGLLHIVDMFRVGFYRFYVPTINDTPIGLCWGWLHSDTQFLGHLCFFKEFWGENSFQGFEKCIELCKEDTNAKEIISYCPTTNSLSKQFCLNAGFADCGIRDNIFTKNSSDVKCYELRKKL